MDFFVISPPSLQEDIQNVFKRVRFNTQVTLFVRTSLSSTFFFCSSTLIFQFLFHYSKARNSVGAVQDEVSETWCDLKKCGSHLPTLTGFLCASPVRVCAPPDATTTEALPLQEQEGGASGEENNTDHTLHLPANLFSFRLMPTFVLSANCTEDQRPAGGDALKRKDLISRQQQVNQPRREERSPSGRSPHKLLSSSPAPIPPTDRNSISGEENL